MKTNKRKVRKCLKCVKKYSCIFDLANGKYLSIFLVIFARIVKVTHFAQVINFCESVHGKIHPRKVDKNREFTFFFCFFFQHNSKTKFIVPSSTQQQKQKVYCPLFFVAFVFRLGSLLFTLCSRTCFQKWNSTACEIE